MKFAKIFERENDQVVVMKGNSDEKHPSLKIVFYVERVGFATAELEYASVTDRDSAYAEATEEVAFDIARAQREEFV